MGWEFAPPPAAPEAPRWKEPEQARSILDMLASQQKKIVAERTWKVESDERIRRFEESVRQEKLMQTQLASADVGPKRDVSLSSMERTYLGYDDRGVLSLTDRSHAPTARSTRPTKQELLDIPVSHIRSLQKTCPAVLANYRAQRARQFITTVSDPDPRAPLPRPEEHRVSFRPAGMLTRHTPLDESDLQPSRARTKKAVAAKRPPTLAPMPSSEQDLLAELKRLTAALESTNGEIERQSLRIALSKKVKTFEKRSTA